MTTIEAVAARVQELFPHLPVTTEHPGFVKVSVGDAPVGDYAFGTANENWSGEFRFADGRARAVWPDSGIPSTSRDVEAIAHWISVVVS